MTTTTNHFSEQASSGTLLELIKTLSLDQTMFKQMNNDGKGNLLLASEEGQSLIKMTANRQH